MVLNLSFVSWENKTLGCFHLYGAEQTISFDPKVSLVSGCSSMILWRATFYSYDVFPGQRLCGSFLARLCLVMFKRVRFPSLINRFDSKTCTHRHNTFFFSLRRRRSTRGATWRRCCINKIPPLAVIKLEKGACNRASSWHVTIINTCMLDFNRWTQLKMIYGRPARLWKNRAKLTLVPAKPLHAQ